MSTSPVATIAVPLPVELNVVENPESTAYLPLPKISKSNESGSALSKLWIYTPNSFALGTVNPVIV